MLYVSGWLVIGVLSLELSLTLRGHPEQMLALPRPVLLTGLCLHRNDKFVLDGILEWHGCRSVCVAADCGVQVYREQSLFLMQQYVWGKDTPWILYWTAKELKQIYKRDPFCVKTRSRLSIKAVLGWCCQQDVIAQKGKITANTNMLKYIHKWTASVSDMLSVSCECETAPKSLFTHTHTHTYTHTSVTAGQDRLWLGRCTVKQKYLTVCLGVWTDIISCDKQTAGQTDRRTDGQTERL